MKQLIQQSQFFTIDTIELDRDYLDISGNQSRRNELTIKEIYNDPIFSQSGRLLITKLNKNDNKYFHELKDINFLFINSKYEFNIILNDSVVLNLNQFTYSNKYKKINVSIQESNIKDHYVEYLYGQFEYENKNIDYDKCDSISMKILERENINPARFDRVLNNIIFTTYDNSEFINISNISDSSSDKTILDINSCYDSIYNG